MAADITNGLTAKTLEGAILKATTSDVPASNGIIHVINGVLILPKK
jgi:uncharacterized surface protein with fasciclin (FAS1) repeats